MYLYRLVIQNEKNIAVLFEFDLSFEKEFVYLQR